MKTSPHIHNEARRLLSAPLTFLLFFSLLFGDINLTADFSVQLPLVVIIDRSSTANPCVCFMQSDRSRPHTASFRSERKTHVAHNGKTLSFKFVFPITG